MFDSFFDKFLTVKFNSIRILMIDIIPKCLKFFFPEIIIQYIVGHFRCMGISNHVIKCFFIKYTLDKCMNTICYILTAFRQRCKTTVFRVCPILFRNFIIVIYIIISDKITIYVFALLVGYGYIRTADFNRLADKVFRCCLCGTFIQIFTDTFLQGFYKITITI